MRLQILFAILVFVIGAGVGDRYGLPAFARSMLSPAFEFIDARISRDRDNAGARAAPDKISKEPAPAQYSNAGGDSANASLTINEAGLDIIRQSEGMRLDAYQSGGQWLIGYGHSRTARAGMTITEAEAERLLREDIAASESAVRALTRVPVNRNQFSAMVSLAYNLGAGAFSKSAVLARLNKGDYAGAADGFLLHNRAGGVVSEHLSERRRRERALFLS
ncbi:MAG: lysozyme [Parvularculaceae bacterium]|nr:lysozyme [Parvularculaceae bacterium]